MPAAGSISPVAHISQHQDLLPTEHAAAAHHCAGDIFSKAVLVGNGLMAIVAGLVGNYLVEDMGLGRVAPFDAAIVVLMAGGAMIMVSWWLRGHMVLLGAAAMVAVTMSTQLRGCRSTKAADPGC